MLCQHLIEPSFQFLFGRRGLLIDSVRLEKIQSLNIQNIGLDVDVRPLQFQLIGEDGLPHDMEGMKYRIEKRRRLTRSIRNSSTDIDGNGGAAFLQQQIIWQRVDGAAVDEETAVNVDWIEYPGQGHTGFDGWQNFPGLKNDLLASLKICCNNLDWDIELLKGGLLDRLAQKPQKFFGTDQSALTQTRIDEIDPLEDIHAHHRPRPAFAFRIHPDDDEFTNFLGGMARSVERGHNGADTGAGDPAGLHTQLIEHLEHQHMRQTPGTAAPKARPISPLSRTTRASLRKETATAAEVIAVRKPRLEILSQDMGYQVMKPILWQTDTASAAESKGIIHRTTVRFASKSAAIAIPRI